MVLSGPQLATAPTLGPNGLQSSRRQRSAVSADSCGGGASNTQCSSSRAVSPTSPSRPAGSRGTGSSWPLVSLRFRSQVAAASAGGRDARAFWHHSVRRPRGRLPAANTAGSALPSHSSKLSRTSSVSAASLEQPGRTAISGAVRYRNLQGHREKCSARRARYTRKGAGCAGACRPSCGCLGHAHFFPRT